MPANNMVFDSAIRRDNLERLFERSGLFTGFDQPHHPFIVVRVNALPMTMVVVPNSEILLNYPDDSVVLCQWPGKHSSDWFIFTVWDYRQYRQNSGTLVMEDA